MPDNNNTQAPRTGEPTRMHTVLAHDSTQMAPAPQTKAYSELAWAAYGGKPPETTEAMFRAVTGGCLPG